MTKRRKHYFTSREIKSFVNPSPVDRMIHTSVAVAMLVLCIGGGVIVAVAKLFSAFEFLRGYTFEFVVVSILSLLVLTPASMGGMLFTLVRRHNQAVDVKNRGIQVANIDAMGGVEFERYLKVLLADRGYTVELTKATGDLGVDIIAMMGGDRIAIQAKRHNIAVSRRAVSDAVAGMHHYGCNKAMVITNNYFSPGAATLAKSTGCILIDREMLADWVTEFQSAAANEQSA